MRSATILITFMVTALFYVLCDAAPHAANLPDTLPDNFNSTDTGVSTNTFWTLGDLQVPNLNMDIFYNKKRCYYWNYSEKWQDVGGKGSDFVRGSITSMCEVIAAYTGSTGFKKDVTMGICKPVDKGTQGLDYDRSIGLKVTYRGTSNSHQDSFSGFTTQYCYELMAKPLDCGAGGEFVVAVSTVPGDIWEVKADPNRNSCSDNGYTAIL